VALVLWSLDILLHLCLRHRLIPP